jgi:SAM-dependent methyltransferase
MDRCDTCGAAFPEEDGLPRLVIPGLRREVRFEFSQARSTIDDGEIDRLMSPPPTATGPGELPYHLDAAHACQITRRQPGARILEIGCGGGQARQWVQGLGHHYVGTDISKTRVFEWLRIHGGPDLLCDAHFLPFQDGQFDIVYAAAVFEHVACPHLVAQEAFRVLRPGGQFLANCAFLEPWHDHSFYHPSPLGAIEWLELAGFEIEHIWPGRGYHTFGAVPSMAFVGPLRWSRHAGTLMHWLFRLQMALRDTRRRLRNQPVRNRLAQEAVVAGAIDWIARRP